MKKQSNFGDWSLISFLDIMIIKKMKPEYKPNIYIPAH